MHSAHIFFALPLASPPPRPPSSKSRNSITMRNFCGSDPKCATTTAYTIIISFRVRRPVVHCVNKYVEMQAASTLCYIYAYASHIICAKFINARARARQRLMSAFDQTSSRGHETRVLRRASIRCVCGDCGRRDWRRRVRA